MSSVQPYNPLDKKNLGVSVADALLNQTPMPMPPGPFEGAGVYAIYYRGKFAPYRALADANLDPTLPKPIYVGKAVPGGRRTGRASASRQPLASRLKQHARSVDGAQNLDLADFWCRYLVVDDIWIPLGESLLIERFSPIWNSVIDGFGNHDPGADRRNQAKSSWDVLHPGRDWANKLQPGVNTQAELVALIEAAVDP